VIARRYLLCGLVLAAASAGAAAQPMTGPRRIGFLSDAAGLSRPVYRTFHVALRDLGYVEAATSSSKTMSTTRWSPSRLLLSAL